MIIFLLCVLLVYLFLTFRLEFIHKFVITEINKLYEYRVRAVINGHYDLADYYKEQYKRIPSYGKLMFKFWMPLEQYSLKQITYSEYLAITKSEAQGDSLGNVVQFKRTNDDK